MRKIMFQAAMAALFLFVPVLALAAEAEIDGRFGPGRHFLQKTYGSQTKHKKAKHARAHRRHTAVAKHTSPGTEPSLKGSVSLAGVTPVLAAKAVEIATDCGSRVVSAVASRPNRSNHPSGKAVDMQGNPSCIYGHLKGWAGGYSTDYSSVNHVHISWNPGGQEWGIRFAHRNPFLGRRYAKHRKHKHIRYAQRR